MIDVESIKGRGVVVASSSVSTATLRPTERSSEILLDLLRAPGGDVDIGFVAGERDLTLDLTAGDGSDSITRSCCVVEGGSDGTGVAIKGE